jgi:hypothetical protein
MGGSFVGEGDDENKTVEAEEGLSMDITLLGIHRVWHLYRRGTLVPE